MDLDYDELEDPDILILAKTIVSGLQKIYPKARIWRMTGCQINFDHDIGEDEQAVIGISFHAEYIRVAIFDGKMGITSKLSELSNRTVCLYFSDPTSLDIQSYRNIIDPYLKELAKRERFRNKSRKT